MLDIDFGIINLLILYFFFKFDVNFFFCCSEIKKGGKLFVYIKLFGVFNYFKYRNIEKF